MRPIIQNVVTPNNEISDCVCDNNTCPCRPTVNSHLTGVLLTTSIYITWMSGIVLAKGFWSTLFAICCPPWAWYLLTEKVVSTLLGVP